MTWNNIGNGNTSTAAQVNQNFQHIIGWSYSPMAGTLMANTSGVHNLGSVRYRWNELYYSNYIAINSGLEIPLSSGVYLNSAHFRGFAFCGNPKVPALTSTSILFAAFKSSSINPTVSGYMTASVSLGFSTVRTTGTGYVIHSVRAFRKDSTGQYSYTGNDKIYYDVTSTGANIHCEFDMSTNTSANTQTAYFYYEYRIRN